VSIVLLSACERLYSGLRVSGNCTPVLSDVADPETEHCSRPRVF